MSKQAQGTLHFPDESESPCVEILELMVAVHLISRLFRPEERSDLSRHCLSIQPLKSLSLYGNINMCPLRDHRRLGAVSASFSFSHPPIEGRFFSAVYWLATVIVRSSTDLKRKLCSDVTSLAEYLPSTSPADLGKPATEDMYLFDPIKVFKLML